MLELHFFFLENSGGKEETKDIKRCDEPNVAVLKAQVLV